MKIPFTKMHGLGNDFVVFNALSKSLGLGVDALQKLADRHTGIGCDQFLFLESAKTKGTDFYCRIFNADGSEAGMSGNGLRCITKFVYDCGITKKRSLVLATFARNVLAVIEDDGQVTLNMGVADFTPKNIPILATQKALSYNLETALGKFDIGAASVGNPHAVVQVMDVDAVDVVGLGSLISQHEFFPDQANVNFMQVLDRGNIKLRTYERGTGETLACGSGSSVAVAIGRAWQLLDEVVTVHLHHGNLQVKLKDINSPLFLTGPAVEVFNGLVRINLE